MDYWSHIQDSQYLPGGDATLELSTEMPLTPSLSASPVSCIEQQHWSKILSLTKEQVMSEFDSYTSPKIYQPPFGHVTPDEMKFPYQLPVTPAEWTAEDTAFCAPTQHMGELSFPANQPMSNSMPVGPGPEPRRHATSGRRRAQNRAAQRAFRERKEQHARDLETALAALTEKYQNLESSHSELNTAYEKLRRTIELLTKDDDGTDEAKSGHSKETLRSLLEIIHGEVGARAATAK